ncbi:MAG: hypothetical protein A2901_05540 [Elusimicrobia bacterium RIFCSPLOWO2_01_FULL_54_10]|nr:MAG: hypothetical protein A2901_05540 [Elusimicrobia bacterium RIFCSPLOWO2_01_FULL_54_10]
MPKERGLGRGLESLIPSHVLSDADPTGAAPASSLTVALDKIKPSRYQPRTRFKEENLSELAESIKSQGIIQPIIVTLQDGGYELIAGERRLRAAKMAGLAQVPIVVRKVTDQEQFVIALIENLQREDLNAIEEARAYKRLMEEFNLTQEALAGMIGKGRVVIANTLRLLNLPQNIQDAVADGSISAGHARSLVSIGDAQVQKEAAEKVLKENITVRDVEKIVSDWKTALETGRVSSPLRKDPQVRELESALERALGTKVEITSRGKAPEIKGQVKISYFSLNDLERLVEILQRK